MDSSAGDKAVKTVFQKVLKPAIESSNPGKVALCCYTFFSRFKAGLAKQHKDVITTTEFLKQYQIKTEMDFIDHCKSKNLGQDPQLNIPHCKKIDKKAEDKIAELAAEVEYLKERLRTLEAEMVEYPVDSTDAEDNVG